MVAILPADHPSVKRARLTKRDLREIYTGTVDGEACWSDGYYLEFAPLPSNATLNPEDRTFTFSSEKYGYGPKQRSRLATPSIYFETYGLVCVALYSREKVPLVALQAQYLHRARMGLVHPIYRVYSGGRGGTTVVYDGTRRHAVIQPLHKDTLQSLLREMEAGKEDVA